MSNLIRYKLGSPFPMSAIGVGCFFILLPLFLWFKVSHSLGYFLSPIFVLGFIIVGLKQSLLINFDSKKFMFQKSLLGVKFGKWKATENLKGIIIRHRVLTDKNTLASKGSFMLRAAEMNRFSKNQYHKEEMWSVQLYYDKSNIITVIDADKLTAISVAKGLQKISRLNIYSGIYNPSRLIDQEEFEKNRVVIFNK
jgi:hypothetical protein